MALCKRKALYFFVEVHGHCVSVRHSIVRWGRMALCERKEFYSVVEVRRHCVSVRHSICCRGRMALCERQALFFVEVHWHSVSLRHYFCWGRMAWCKRNVYGRYALLGVSSWNRVMAVSFSNEFWDVQVDLALDFRPWNVCWLKAIKDHLVCGTQSVYLFDMIQFDI